jgi:membrane-associated phospholipid phosphatase
MVGFAALAAAGFAVLMGLAYYVPQARFLDAASLHGFAALQRPSINGIADFLAQTCNPAPYAVVGVGTILLALGVRGARTAAAVTVLLVGANVSSQVLKPLLAQHRELYFTDWHLNNIHDGSYPSGHATAAMAISLALLIVVPRAYRPLTAALGVLFTLAVTFSILLLSWHFPSDIVGGFLVATAWGLVTMAALRYANERWPAKGSMRKAARAALPAPSPATLAKIGVAIAAIACVAAAGSAHRIASFADRHTALVAVASAIAVAALVLLAGVASLSSRSGRSSSSSS